MSILLIALAFFAVAALLFVVCLCMAAADIEPVREDVMEYDE